MSTTKAFAAVENLTARATIYLGLAVVAAFIGVIVVSAAFTNDSYGFDGTLQITWGIILLSAAGVLLTAWLFTASIRDHAKVVFYAAGHENPAETNKESNTQSESEPKLR